MNGLNEDRMAGVGFDFFAELRDVLIEGATVGHVLVTPSMIVDLVASEDLVRVLAEDF